MIWKLSKSFLSFKNIPRNFPTSQKHFMFKGKACLWGEFMIHRKYFSFTSVGSFPPFFIYCASTWDFYARNMLIVVVCQVLCTWTIGTAVGFKCSRKTVTSSSHLKFYGTSIKIFIFNPWPRDNAHRTLSTASIIQLIQFGHPLDLLNIRAHLCFI